jgi:hypothetical protein
MASPLAFAQQDARQIALKDGSTLLVYKDGKMSMRDKNGKIVSMKDGLQMETKDGQVLMMKGNEIWRKTSTEKQLEELYRGN